MQFSEWDARRQYLSGAIGTRHFYKLSDCAQEGRMEDMEVNPGPLPTRVHQVVFLSMEQAIGRLNAFGDGTV